MTVRIEHDRLVALLTAIFRALGTGDDVARQIAGNCAACERDGAKSHGIFRMRGYVSTLQSDWMTPSAVPVVEDAGAAFVRVDAAGGFAQPALAAARDLVIARTRENGACVLSIRNSHHFSALWPDVEPFAEAGLIALSALNSMAVVVPAGAQRAVFGTNPIAFAAPMRGGVPVVFDMATSAMAHGDIQIARREGHTLPDGAGVDAEGQPTNDPDRILTGGALLPFGGHKGSAISMMIELLGAALTGGKFSTEIDFSACPGARIPHTGQFLLLIDPARSGGLPFDLRAAELVATMREAGLSRMPGARRYRNRADSDANGIPLSQAEWDDLLALAAEVDPGLPAAFTAG